MDRSYVEEYRAVHSIGIGGVGKILALRWEAKPKFGILMNRTDSIFLLPGRDSIHKDVNA